MVINMTEALWGFKPLNKLVCLQKLMSVGNEGHSQLIAETEASYLNSIDVDPAHASTAVNEEDEFPLDAPQVRGCRAEVWAEVEHDHGVVKDVFMKPLLNDVHLHNTHQPVTQPLLKAIMVKAGESHENMMSLYKTKLKEKKKKVNFFHKAHFQEF